MVCRKTKQGYFGVGVQAENTSYGRCGLKVNRGTDSCHRHFGGGKETTDTSTINVNATVNTLTLLTKMS